MTLEWLDDLSDILLTVSAFSLLWIVPIALFLDYRAAVAWRSGKRSWALNLMALLATGVALLEIAYVISATNNALGMPIPVPVTRFGFRAAALVVALFPPLFVVAYRRRWFRDGEGR